MPRNGSNVYSPPADTLATTLTTIKSPNYNAFVNDVAADLNLARPVVAGGTGQTTIAGTISAFSLVAYSSQTLTAAQQAQARANVSSALNGQLYGLTLSNNATDATNDIDIAVGEAASTETNPVLMVLASALTKRLDAAWAVGSGNGGLDTGSIADTTYHVWLIQRSDTGVVDSLFSTSATSPTMPANYDRKRRIGSVIRTSAAIRLFRQIEDRFLWAAPVSNRSSTAAATNILLSVSVPSGIRARPILVSSLSIPASSASSNTVGDGDNPAANVPVQQINGPGFDVTVVDCVYTDTSNQIRFSTSIGAGTISANLLQTAGYYDMRGRV